MEIDSEKTKYLIDQEQINKWQNALNLIAKFICVPAALIMKVESPYIEVFTSSETNGNPYNVGDRELLPGLYCETVLKSKGKLFIPNALKDPDWDKNPDIKLGMIAYLGYPLFWPDGNLFGTICVLDNKENHFNRDSEDLLIQFKSLVENDLDILYKQTGIEQLCKEKELAEEELIFSNRLLKNQINVLEKLVTGKPLKEIFDALTLGAEQNVKNAMASILLLDNSGTKLFDGSTPSFSQTVRDAFNGMVIGPLEGSCGAAAYSKRITIVEDISIDPRWEKFKDFARSQGLKACFSAPILDSKGDVLGTFALTFKEAKYPSDFELEIIQSSSYIAGLAIEQKRSAENLRAYANELESFASIASHDLQEPLRKIVTFGDRLATRIPESDDQGKDYLNRMQNSALRMRNLVEDLLQYTRVENKQRAFESLDLNKVIETVLEDLETRISETEGAVNIVDLPVIDGDPIQIHQLFLNLIGNALKFHRKGIPPVVNLNKTKACDGFWEISVEDNGIGIKEEHVDKIFKPFERLHGRTTYEGTGIGLTICNKIVSRHGGKITVKRQSTNGVTFHITLPEKQDF